MTKTSEPHVIEHPSEDLSNDLRRRLADVEPRAQRTFTPSLAAIARSAGCYHWTCDGRKLADFTSGVLVANLGHNPIAWWRAVWRYLGLDHLPSERSGFTVATPLTTYNATCELEIEAAERLIDNLRGEPGGQRCEQVLWAASGSEAVQKALWAALARRGTQGERQTAGDNGSEKIILATRFGFHGKKGLAGATTGSEKDAERDPRVRFISFPSEECIDTARRAQPLDLSRYAAELADEWRQHGSRIRALITEPYLGGGGSFHPQPEYLQLLQRFCREHDIAFILDEIQSGFGRTGPMYAFTHYGLEPDLLCLGKGLGNGMPVAVVAGRADILAALDYGEGSDTYSGNPLAAAAVLATLDEFESTDVLQRSAELAGVLREGLERIARLAAVAHLRGEGLVWGIEFIATGNRSAAETARAAVAACYLGDDQGRAIHLLGPLAGTVVRIAPPLIMPPDEAREYLAAMHQILANAL
ncbi:MAG TPA: aminotransferase class III-fold pyridoxal phosphate-dependent enzyme [Pirellulales bacterium]|jgi:4-aminobutyrate aminotransferase-like enzyme|nr:aminotransferase class III-fold pyridoxal phosphate-dependent enzyme [Pirellulales bacterium]